MSDFKNHEIGGTLKEVLESLKFRQNIADEIKKIHDARNKARRAGPLKTNPVQRLMDKGYFSTDKMMAEYKEVLFKRSKLPSSERRLIESIGDKAFYEALQYLAKEKQLSEESLAELK